MTLYISASVVSFSGLLHVSMGWGITVAFLGLKRLHA